MLVEISNGDIVDRVAIVRIKLGKVTDARKKANLDREHRALLPAFEEIGIASDSHLFGSLLDVNLDIWYAEEVLRKKEKEKVYDDEFIQMARNVYLFNDKRAEIKRQINLNTKSNLVEEKMYDETG